MIPFAWLPENGSHDEPPFKRQVAGKLIAGETLHALSQRHGIPGQMIRAWVGKFEAGALDDGVQATDLLQAHEAKIGHARHGPDRPSGGETLVNTELGFSA